jgi:hypothetical protein
MNAIPIHHSAELSETYIYLFAVLFATCFVQYWAIIRKIISVLHCELLLTLNLYQLCDNSGMLYMYIRVRCCS